MAMYFVRLSSTALFAARINVSLSCDSGNVSRTATFQTGVLPSDYGINVEPSARFTSVVVKPTGSLATRI